MAPCWLSSPTRVQPRLQKQPRRTTRTQPGDSPTDDRYTEQSPFARVAAGITVERTQTAPRPMGDPGRRAAAHSRTHNEQSGFHDLYAAIVRRRGGALRGVAAHSHAACAADIHAEPQSQPLRAPGTRHAAAIPQWLAHTPAWFGRVSGSAVLRGRA